MGYQNHIIELRQTYNKKVKEILEYLNEHDAYATTDYYKGKEIEMITFKKVIKDLTKIIYTLY
jgi:hypothetical protein